MTEEEIKDRLTKTCVCKQVTRDKIKKAIAEGADSLEKIKSETGALTGHCKGGRCRGSIENLLQESSNR